MIRELHFPTPVYILDIKDKSLNEPLEKDILDWCNKDKGVSRTNVNGWHSTTDMHEKPEYQRLVNALYEAQNKIYIEEHLAKYYFSAIPKFRLHTPKSSSQVRNSSKFPRSEGTEKERERGRQRDSRVLSDSFGKIEHKNPLVSKKINIEIVSSE